MNDNDVQLTSDQQCRGSPLLGSSQTHLKNYPYNQRTLTNVPMITNMLKMGQSIFQRLTISTDMS